MTNMIATTTEIGNKMRVALFETDYKNFQD
jgi:hypothetical protein